MAIKHTKVSGKADGADATLVQPSDWNSTHTIDDGTLVAVKMGVSTQRAIGRNSGGTGNGEEVTASQILDWVSSTNGVLLTRIAGTWGAVANVSSDGNDLRLANNASPTAPAANISTVFSQSVGGRPMMGWVGAAGLNNIVQPLWARKRVGLVGPQITSNGLTLIGLTTPQSTGTITARSLTTTNQFTGAVRTGWVSTSSANAVAGWRLAASNANHFWRGGGTQQGGFFVVYRFMIADPVIVSTANMFIGIQAATAAPTDVAPSTLVNLLGVGCDNGDTHLQLYSSGAAAQTRVDLGASFPVNTTNVDAYELALYCPPNASSITYQVARLNTGDIASGTISVSANLPSTTTFLGQNIYRSNGGTAAVVGFDMFQHYFETDI